MYDHSYTNNSRQSCNICNLLYTKKETTNTWRGISFNCIKEIRQMQEIQQYYIPNVQSTVP